MKNAATILADAPTTSLKLAYSYLVPVFDQPAKKSEPLKQAYISNKSIYRDLFSVHPSIKDEAAWDAAWFGNYE